MTIASRHPSTLRATAAFFSAAALCTGTLLGACRSTGEGLMQPLADIDGSRFFCSSSTALCLSTLEGDCSLGVKDSDPTSIPPEAEQVAVLSRGSEHKVVSGPNELAGCVSVASPEDALEYLRFFSSFRTVHLFEDQLLEVFPARRPAYLFGPKGTCYTCLPPDRWRDLGLDGPRVESVDDGFLVTRYVVRPAPEDSNASDLFRVTQWVGHDGRVELLAKEEVPGLTPAERYGLSFPHYL